MKQEEDNKGLKMETVYVCPFIITSGVNVTPDFRYPMRACVVNEKEGYAIDINTRLKYDYLPTVSRLYVLTEFVNKIRNDRRVAIYSSLASILLSIEEVRKGNRIISQINNGKVFVNGNDVMDNESYLDFVTKKANKKSHSPKQKSLKRKNSNTI